MKPKACSLQKLVTANPRLVSRESINNIRNEKEDTVITDLAEFVLT